jgi:class 3 adenylate cyclase
VSAVADPSSRTFIGSVVFVDIIGYSKRTVSEQIVLKDRFTGLLSAALTDIAPDQRLILDTGDGAALSFLGDPEDALFVSMHLRDMVRKDLESNQASELPVDVNTEALPLRIGINLGPVKMVRDINGHPNIVGDGINVAQRIMGFANEGQVVVSRSFFDVVSVISDEYAKLFRYEGSRTDKHIREHEIYVVGESEAAFDKVREGFESRAAMSATNAYLPYSSSSTGAYAAPVPLPWHKDTRKLTVIGGSLGAVVLAMAILIALKKPTNKVPDVVAAPASSAQPSAPVSVATPEAPKTGAPIEAKTDGKPDAAGETKSEGKTDSKPEPKTDAKSEAKTAAKSEPKADGKTEPKVDAKSAIVLGTVNFQVGPWGEVVVNGKVIGVSPPLKQHKLPPGKYKIEVRNSTFAPHIANVEVKARDEVVVRHTFR